MFSLLSWMTGASERPSAVVRREGLVEQDMSQDVLVDPEFLRALIGGHQAIYQKPEYIEEISRVSLTTLVCLMQCNSHIALTWLLSQRKFDLAAPIPVRNDLSLSLLGYAIKLRRVDGFLAVSDHDSSTALSVSIHILREIAEADWMLFYGQIEKNRGQCYAPIRYVNLQRRIDIKERELENGQGTQKEQRVKELGKMREKFLLLEREILGWELCSTDEMSEDKVSCSP